MSTLWGGRFSKEQSQVLAEFSESISFDIRLYKHDIAGSIAHAKMLCESELISKNTCERIVQALKEIQQDIEEGNFYTDINLEDIHMHIENALIERIGDDGAKLHTGRSRNDQISLDVRLYLREETENIVNGLRDIQKALITQAKNNIDIILPGYTHLQRAQPVLLSHQLLAYTEMLERDIQRFNDCLKRFDILPLGSGALAGSTLPLQRERTAELLNFPEVSRNSMDAVADRDFLCEFLSDASILTMHISRISEDIIIWASQEFGFIELSDEFCTGSSLMPHKKNPDIAELCRGKSGKIFGNLMSVLTLLKGLPLTYNRDLQEDKKALFETVDNVKSILSVFAPMLSSISFSKDNMLDASSDPALMATDLAEQLVKLDLPFRKAHQRVGKLVKWCSENNLSLNELNFEQMKKIIPEADEECLNVFSPEKSISKRNIKGATGKKEVEKQLKFWTERIFE